MLRSDERILTTHCGSLPRPPHLSDLLLRQEAGEAIDESLLQRESAAAVADVLARQLEAGIDIVSDGEQPRVGFSMYVPQRMTGFGGEAIRPTPLDHDEFPLFAALRQARAGRRNRIGNPPSQMIHRQPIIDRLPLTRFDSPRRRGEAVALVGDNTSVYHWPGLLAWQLTECCVTPLLCRKTANAGRQFAFTNSSRTAQIKRRSVNGAQKSSQTERNLPGYQ